MFNHLDDPQKIAELTGYTFNNLNLLAQALTRKSAIHHKLQDKSIGHFETVEWLGDSVLSLAVTSLLKTYHNDKTEGELTQLRSKLTKNDGPLPRVARHLGLDKFIIRTPTEQLTDKKLADHMEALIGAIFLDSQEDYKVVKKFIEKHWELLGLNEDNLSVSDFGGASLIETTDVSGKREEQLNRALFKAITNDKCEKIDLLISQGANIEARDQAGNTPIIIAYLKSKKETVEYLYEEHRANIDAINNQGQGLLHLAAYYNDEDTIEFLLENMAEVNVKDKQGNTPAHLAAQQGHLTVLKSLHKAGADLTLENQQKQNVRTVAAANHKQLIVNYIKQVQAEQDQLDQELISLLEPINGDFELSNKKDHIIELISKGANPFSKNKAGKNTFQVIAEKSTLFGSKTSSKINFEILREILPKEGAELTNLALDNIQNIYQIDFSLLNLQEADFKSSWFTYVNFYKTNLAKSNFTDAHFRQVDFTKANITEGDFTNVSMDRYSFETFIAAFLDCQKAVKFSVRLDDVELNDIHLGCFELSQLTFDYTRFNKETFISILPKLKQGNIITGKVDIRGLSLNDLDLTSVSLANTIIDRVTLESLLPLLRAGSIKLAGVTVVGSEGKLDGFYQYSRLSKVILDGLDLSNLDLRGIQLSGASLHKTNLLNTNLSYAVLEECDFSQAVIAGANLANVKLNKNTLQSIVSTNKTHSGIRASLPGITIYDASYLDLSNLDLTSAEFSPLYSNSKIEFVNFSNSILKNVQFNHINFKYVNFTNVDLSYKDLSKVTFEEVNFTGANLEGVKLSGQSLWPLIPLAKAKKISLKKADLSNAHLTSSLLAYGVHFTLNSIDFTGIDVEGINFQGATITQAAFLSLLPAAKSGKISLQNVKLTQIDATNVDLSGLNLTGVTAIDVNFTGANLTGVILNNAKLKNVKFIKANLTNSNFTSSYLDSVNVKEANVTGMILSNSHMNRLTLDSFLRHARIRSINLNYICLEDIRVLINYHDLISTRFSLKGCDMTNVELRGVQFQEHTEIDKRLLISILPQVRQSQLTLKGLCLDFELKGIDFTGISLDGAIINKQAFRSLLAMPNFNNFKGIKFMSRTDLKGIDLTHTNLAGINFAEVRLNRQHVEALLPQLKNQLISLSGAALHHADLSNLDLVGIDLKDANLCNVNFTSAKLQNCSLNGAQIRGANFTNADLSKADFSNTNTDSYTNNTNTNFKGANFYEVNLAGAKWLFNITNLTTTQLSLASNIEQAELKDKLKEGAMATKKSLAKHPSEQISYKGHSLVGLTFSMEPPDRLEVVNSRNLQKSKPSIS